MPRLGPTVAALRMPRPPGAEARSGGRLQPVSGSGSNPGRLAMKVHAPVDRGPGAALVVVLHGCTQTADEYAAAAGWLDLADRFGFVVLTPEQARPNNPNLCFNWFQGGDIRRTGGEAESIAQMIAHAVRAHDLDPRRVFVTGLSAGGAMTGVMLATWPELFAGGAIVAGLPYGIAGSVGEAMEAMKMTDAPPAAGLGAAVRGASAHPGPWPTVSVWHGQSDRVVRPAAGEAVAAQWREVHGATGPARTARTPDGRDFLVWLSPDGEPAVELHRIGGLGHGAPVMAEGPNGCGHASRYTPETGVSSSFEIALGWGLVERDAAAARPEPRTPVRPATTERPAPARPAPADGVSRVINDALRAAGLLR
ncbi:MAG: PHB depolymerase family esterase [Alphaproteobacteria bacterium]|nr:PHB depolymerase family esterase [Alphaproteobacteria bacterium]MBU2270796.1 PHB depolymerase family esterase [Alphaproteobacteria bacterium]MBU2418651.1 PHB depolymerase family esterase [Alphaproteobacteria bacterium]